MIVSRIPEIAATLPTRMDRIVRECAEVVADGARERVPRVTSALHDAIHVKPEGIGEYSVVAGDDKAWYGMLVENGTVRAPAQPFLMPAAEAARPQFETIGAAGLAKL